MNATDELMIRFYQHLGELFYAVAKADKVVRKEEERTLKAIISEEWLDLEDTEDEFHTDAAYQIESVFDALNDSDSEAEHWFEDFKLFKESHEQLFTPKVKELIMRTANSIASSFSGTNKSELDMLLRLELLLK
ncbi:MAG: hypothetical protein HKN45_04890 [Flavobacteriales bacterium]|nr:hypothetical protein [Flavobacteriales bacterium]